MLDEEKKAIERLSLKAITSSIEAPDYPNAIVMKKDLITLLNLIEKQQKEIEELESNECIYKETSSCSKALSLKTYMKSFESYIKLKDVDKKWEDKIKATIEEYDDKGMTVNLVNRSAGKTFQQVVRNEVRKVLQSLLEKE